MPIMHYAEDEDYDYEEESLENQLSLFDSSKRWMLSAAFKEPDSGVSTKQWKRFPKRNRVAAMPVQRTSVVVCTNEEICLEDAHAVASVGQWFMAMAVRMAVDQGIEMEELGFMNDEDQEEDDDDSSSD